MSCMMSNSPPPPPDPCNDCMQPCYDPYDQACVDACEAQDFCACSVCFQDCGTDTACTTACEEGACAAQGGDDDGDGGPPTREEVEAGCPVSFPVCAASDACDAELTSALASEDKPDLTGASDEFKNVIVCAMMVGMRNDPDAGGMAACAPPAEEAPATPPALQASGSAP